MKNNSSISLLIIAGLLVAISFSFSNSAYVCGGDHRSVFAERVYHIEHKGRYVSYKESRFKELKRIFRYRKRGRNVEIRYTSVKSLFYGNNSGFADKETILTAESSTRLFLPHQFLLRGPPVAIAV